MADAAAGTDQMTPAPDRWRLIVPVLALGCLTLLGYGGWVLQDLRDHQDQDDRRTAAVATASRAVTYLVTLDGDSAQANLDSLLAMTRRGEFRDGLGQLAKSFQGTVEDGDVSSVGEIRSAGLVRMNGSEAVVAVAASATVKNKDAPAGEPRNYRLDVTLDRTGDGWKIESMEFVS